MVSVVSAFCTNDPPYVPVRQIFHILVGIMRNQWFPKGVRQEHRYQESSLQDQDLDTRPSSLAPLGFHRSMIIPPKPLLQIMLTRCCCSETAMIDPLSKPTTSFYLLALFLTLSPPGVTWATSIPGTMMMSKIFQSQILVALDELKSFSGQERPGKWLKMFVHLLAPCVVFR